MPELPDLVYIEKHLAPIIVGKRIHSFEIAESIVIRNMLGEGGLTHLQGKGITALHRHGPFLQMDLEEDLCILIHFMLAGRFSVSQATADPISAATEGGERKKKKRSQSYCFTIYLDELSLDYLDDKRMGKVYLCKTGDLPKIAGYSLNSPDILDPAFTLEYFLKAMGKSRRQVRVFIKDHSLVNSVGNAYADEILFEAQIHPKRTCSSLDPAERERLYHAVLDVMRHGIEEVERADRGVDAKVRDHMKVRNRKDQPCPRCGSKIRRANVLGFDSFYCPGCQPLQKDLFSQLDSVE